MLKMTTHNSIRYFIVAAVAAMLAASCVTPAKVNYLQDMMPGTQIELENKFEAVISPYDELNIVVSSFDQDLAAPFNASNLSSSVGASGAYLVDVNGNIQFPILGELHVAGLTRLRLQDSIAARLKDGGYIPDPYVMVRFSNFKIFFLGSNSSHVLTIPNEHCNFLEALAMSGGLTPYTNRSRIAVMREVDGVMTMRYLDPRSSKIFNDHYFMLQQNDFIITDAADSQVMRAEVSYWLGWISTGLSFVSLVTTLLLYNNLSAH